MNKINLNINKKKISLSVLVLLIIAFIYPIYFVNYKIRNYKNEALGDYKKFAELENEKKVLNTYNQISSKDSNESMQIKKYVLSSDRKEVLGFINDLENYAKKVNLVENESSPIVSVEVRENANITKYNAADLVINIKLTGSQKNIDSFINTLNNIPLVSYIEKIDIKYNSPEIRNNASIVLVIYQTK